MSARDLDWSEITHFSSSEWPEGVLDHMGEGIILALNDWRNSLPSSHSMTPSPLYDAHVRQTGTSRHSLEGGRESDATDVFVSNEYIWDAWLAAQRIPEIGGIGVYLDTKPSVMFHIDTRPDRLLWVRLNGEYIYFHREPNRFLKVMSEYTD